MARVHPEDVAKAEELIMNLDLGQEPHLSEEYRMLDKDNNYEWYSIEAVAYKRNEIGTITSYLGLRRNNTKWKMITEDLIVLRNRAEASTHLMSAFLSNLSHDIRPPLNAILGFSDLLTDTEDLDAHELYHSLVQTSNELLLPLIIASRALS